jgi:prepilin-type N-terminal cleavage/methylation domain-containing protein
MLNNEKGLTLIEIIIVLCIIGIVAAMVIPNILGVKKKSYHPSNREIVRITDEVAQLETAPAKVTLIAEIDGYKLYTVKTFSGEMHILIPPKYIQDVAKIVE